MNTRTTYLASKPHYEILDGLRGVAAVMVIIFHLFEAHAGGSHLTQIINHGYLAVDFFFMLSGVVIGYAYDDRWNRMTVGTFFKRRIIRLHPMVIMGSIVGAVFFYFQVITFGFAWNPMLVFLNNLISFHSYIYTERSAKHLFRHQ